MSDPVNHPAHYTEHPSGVECIQITEHMNFCVGNAIKYLWRAGLKGDAREDLEKARWYITRELQRLENSPHDQAQKQPDPRQLDWLLNYYSRSALDNAASAYAAGRATEGEDPHRGGSPR